MKLNFQLLLKGGAHSANTFQAQHSHVRRQVFLGGVKIRWSQGHMQQAVSSPSTPSPPRARKKPEKSYFFMEFLCYTLYI